MYLLDFTIVLEVYVRSRDGHWLLISTDASSWVFLLFVGVVEVSETDGLFHSEARNRLNFHEASYNITNVTSQAILHGFEEKKLNRQNGGAFDRRS